ncbi:serine/threonine-protein kinase [Gordonia sp. ABSL1-1]|uniref:serine/threonine-protein kinase n=1 Tax=Gordonia sp. ABSL1-1 TaxID=3053923 RepID=UPI002572EF97|nr:serine/threonine-protein kinase [Gordonia sp. ABSL1-1]MDL9938273.1 serine/threonine-protein kinase [Gordonia sp. ABSL1-1]
MSALEPGRVFAGYTVERLLGVGGMGEVYAARHPRLPRSDALKVLSARIADDAGFRQRFEREADHAASLSHPGIVGVHDRGESDGRLWIAYALVDGVDLAAALAHQPTGLPADRVTEAISAIASALDYAGARGLVHRDVKPANILVSSGGHVMLTDFGIARMGPTESGLTVTGLTLGTVDYSSPEQLQGLREHAGGCHHRARQPTGAVGAYTSARPQRRRRRRTESRAGQGRRPAIREQHRLQRSPRGRIVDVLGGPDTATGHRPRTTVDAAGDGDRHPAHRHRLDRPGGCRRR